MGAYLYILRCADGSYYVGTTIAGLDGGWPSIRPAISTDTPLCADPSNWYSINISTASKMLLPPNGKSKAGAAKRRRL